MNDSAPHFESEALLDNPIWNSLATRDAHLAIGAHIGHGLARRYPADIGPVSAVQEPTAEAYADLAAIVPQDDVAVLFLEHSLQIPAGWQLLRVCRLSRMVPRLWLEVSTRYGEEQNWCPGFNSRISLSIKTVVGRP